MTEGKQDSEFEKKPELALKLIDRTIERKYQPGIVIVDAEYGNNTSFLLELEKRQLKYLGGLAKNRKVTLTTEDNIPQQTRLDELAQSLPTEAFTKIKLDLDKPKTDILNNKKVMIQRFKALIILVLNTRNSF